MFFCMSCWIHESIMIKSLYRRPNLKRLHGSVIALNLNLLFHFRFEKTLGRLLALESSTPPSTQFCAFRSSFGGLGHCLYVARKRRAWKMTKGLFNDNKNSVSTASSTIMFKYITSTSNKAQEACLKLKDSEEQRNFVVHIKKGCGPDIFLYYGITQSWDSLLNQHFLHSSSKPFSWVATISLLTASDLLHAHRDSYTRTHPDEKMTNIKKYR